MVYWSAVFFIVALIAGAMGFGGVAEATAGTAQILFFVSLIGFMITLVAGLFTGSKTRNALTAP
ncbi:MAG: DUF1328 domain-containing protein [Bdellovibrionota bacterium]